MARILVKIDLKLGLSTNIQIQTLSGTITQIFDYKASPLDATVVMRMDTCWLHELYLFEGKVSLMVVNLG